MMMYGIAAAAAATATGAAAAELSSHDRTIAVELLHWSVAEWRWGGYHGGSNFALQRDVEGEWEE